MPEETINEVEIENPIEITEGQETVVEETAVDLEGLQPEEIEMAKEQGLITEEDLKPTEEAKVEKEVKEDGEFEINKDPDNFEEMDKVIEKDEKKFHETYTANQKALYFKSKANNKKRQDAIKELNDTKAKLEEALKGSRGQAKLDKIADILANKSDELTIEMLQSIINEKEVVAEPSKTAEEAQLNLVRERIAQKNQYAEQIGNAQHKNFNEIAKLANELYQSDRENGTYRSAIDSAYSDSVDEQGLVNTIVQVAKFHPKYNEVSQEVSSEEKK